jgi:heme-degrading monooxygenase HmoA
MKPLAKTPRPPYYAVIFTSIRTEGDDEGYGSVADRMVELGSQQPGFLRIESVRDSDRVGITVSYWESLEAIAKWKQNLEHLQAQQLDRSKWYQRFGLRVCRIEYDYGFEAK